MSTVEFSLLRGCRPAPTTLATLLFPENVLRHLAKFDDKWVVAFLLPLWSTILHLPFRTTFPLFQRLSAHPPFRRPTPSPVPPSLLLIFLLLFQLSLFYLRPFSPPTDCLTFLTVEVGDRTDARLRLRCSLTFFQLSCVIYFFFSVLSPATFLPSQSLLLQCSFLWPSESRHS